LPRPAVSCRATTSSTSRTCSRSSSTAISTRATKSAISSTTPGRPTPGRAKIGAHPRWGWPQARWGLGHTFGNRRLVNCTVVLAVGLAAILTALRPHRALRRAALVLGCVLVGLNVVAMWLWSTGPVGPLPAADTW
jgi:hypothetical protein